MLIQQWLIIKLFCSTTAGILSRKFVFVHKLVKLLAKREDSEEIFFNWLEDFIQSFEKIAIS